VFITGDVASDETRQPCFGQVCLAWKNLSAFNNFFR